MKNLNFAECCYECLDLLPIYIWMFNNWSAPKTCGWLLKILWDWEEFEVAWIIIKGLLARSWDVTTDFFTTQFSVFEGGWPKRITISLLLTKPIFILLFNEIVSHVLQHDTKSWMNWSRWALKKTADGLQANWFQCQTLEATRLAKSMEAPQVVLGRAHTLWNLYWKDLSFTQQQVTKLQY